MPAIGTPPEPSNDRNVGDLPAQYYLLNGSYLLLGAETFQTGICPEPLG